jgi:hypothetical protein
VFGSILFTVLIATLATHAKQLPFGLAVVALVALVLVTWAVPVDWLVGRDLLSRLALSVLYVGAPVSFASICFALRFRTRPAADVAFGWNTLGAVLGGLLEFGSMALGLGAMHLLAGLTYAVIALLWARERGGKGALM